MSEFVNQYWEYIGGALVILGIVAGWFGSQKFKDFVKNITDKLTKMKDA